MVNLFSVGALFIMYREALEAAVVISVMISIMERLGFKSLKRQGARHPASSPGSYTLAALCPSGKEIHHTPLI